MEEGGGGGGLMSCGLKQIPEIPEIIIQHTVTLPKYDHGRPLSADVLRYTRLQKRCHLKSINHNKR